MPTALSTETRGSRGKAELCIDAAEGQFNGCTRR